MKHLTKINIVISVFTLLVIFAGCAVDSLSSSLNEDSDNNSNNISIKNNVQKSGVYFSQKSIIFNVANIANIKNEQNGEEKNKNNDGVNILNNSNNNSRTALPNDSDIEDLYTDIKLYKKVTSASGDYGDAIATYKTYDDISDNPVFIEIDAGNYNFKLTVKIGEVLYTQELVNVTVGTDAQVLQFTKLSAATGTGSIKIKFTAYESVLNNVDKVFAKLDGAESQITLTSDKDYRGTYKSGTFTKSEVTTGSKRVDLLFKDTAGNILITYPLYAYIYAGLESCESVTLNITSSNTLLICTITYNANGGTGTNKSQKLDVDSKLYTFSESGFSAPAGKKFIAWSDAATGSSGNIYNALDKPTLSGNTTLYARYLDYDTTNDAYKIATKDDLVIFMNVSTANKGVLQNDISLGNWVPPNKFLGTLDGNNKSLTMTVNQENAAFVNELSGEIKNLTIKDSTFTSYSKGAAVAIDVANGGKITNCTVKDTNINVTQSQVHEEYKSTIYAAGVAVTVKEGGTLTSCSTLGGSVKGHYAAGLAACNYGTVDTTGSSVTTTITHYEYGGGVAAYNYSTGKITGNGTAGATFTDTSDDWGNVVGAFDFGTDDSGNNVINISKNITVSNSTTIVSNEDYTNKHHTVQSYKIHINQTGRIKLTIAAKNEGTTVYGFITSKDYDSDSNWNNYSNVESDDLGKLTKIQVTKNSTGTTYSPYLTSGDYYITMKNENVALVKSYGIYTVTVEQAMAT